MQVSAQESLKKESKMHLNSKVGLAPKSAEHIRVLARHHLSDVKTHPFPFFSNKDVSQFIF